MNILDDLRAEWIAVRKSLGDHTAYLEAGNKIHPIDQDPNEATIEFVKRLKQYRSEVEGWLGDSSGPVLATFSNRMAAETFAEKTAVERPGRRQNSA